MDAAQDPMDTIRTLLDEFEACVLQAAAYRVEVGEEDAARVQDVEYARRRIVEYVKAVGEHGIALANLGLTFQQGDPDREPS